MEGFFILYNQILLLMFQFIVKHSVDEVEEQSYAEEEEYKNHRGLHRVIAVCQIGRNPKDGKYAQTSYAHFNSHSERHFLSLKPLYDSA